MLELKENIQRCKYAIPNATAKEMEYICVADGWDDNHVREIHKEDCEKCERYKSRFIEYPLTIQGIENQKINTEGLGRQLPHALQTMDGACGVTSVSPVD